ncbi:hypothetical protein POSPLADRAFT_1041792 [Postia placenta MAD-698-R-SB12]|uniref:Uncharacterized protein n=1 Tax=Postia placenta MAD-698-R-SB12 TaxID=670580 RepID=A0A1X6ML09_9APHY|nr:hypothetical protein POSPLADRAFT_1041792 [Postia placenta MAD-698-R-SB12]OSX56926.1 hypothetical protein POSPLADRAFT_1041792 [Postia placenta MAD-698-R-SB12]
MRQQAVLCLIVEGQIASRTAQAGASFSFRYLSPPSSIAATSRPLSAPHTRGAAHTGWMVVLQTLYGRHEGYTTRQQYTAQASG